MRYVIDPCFQEQFEIANPTPRYTAILSEVPHEFVGTEDRVAALVGLLSNEIKRSFQARYPLICLLGALDSLLKQ